MTVVFGGLTPHAPVLIPAIGRQATARLSATVKAMQALARRVAAEEPDVVVIVSSPAQAPAGRFGLLGRETLLGDFAHHRAPHLAFEVPGDPLLASRIADQARAMGLAPTLLDGQHSVPLDEGVAVPLYYLQAAGFRGGVLPVTIGPGDRLALRRIGAAIAQAASALGKRAVLLASGEFASTAPAGDPAAAAFDREVFACLNEGAWERVFALGDAPAAGETGYRSLLVLLGALEGSLPRANLLAFEGPTGVGYATLSIDIEASDEQDQVFNPAGYARQVVDTFVQTDRLAPAPGHFPPEPRGCFVCLERDGRLEICVGSLAPAEHCLAAEVARHALEAVRDYAERPHFGLGDLQRLTFMVDLVTSLEPIDSIENQLPAVHGLELRAGEAHAIVLPNMAGLDTADRQLAYALEQAGLPADALAADHRSHRVTLRRFTVERHREQARPAW